MLKIYEPKECFNECGRNATTSYEPAFSLGPRVIALCGPCREEQAEEDAECAQELEGRLFNALSAKEA